MMDGRDETLNELAELYALGGLEPDERAAVEAHRKSEGCQEALKRGQTGSLRQWRHSKGRLCLLPSDLRE